MIRHLVVFLVALVLLLGSGALWIGLTARGADRALPDDRLMVWMGRDGARDPNGTLLVLTGTGLRLIDSSFGGRLWVVAADGPESAEILRRAGAKLVLAQPLPQTLSLGGCGPFIPFDATTGRVYPQGAGQ